VGHPEQHEKVLKGQNVRVPGLIEKRAYIRNDLVPHGPLEPIGNNLSPGLFVKRTGGPLGLSQRVIEQNEVGSGPVRITEIP
jgi:hypothetical protein